MKKKFFMYYVVLVVVGMTITGFFISQLVQTLYKRDVEEKLISIAKLIQSEITEDVSEGKSIDYDVFAVKYAKILKTPPQSSIIPASNGPRVTIINFNGEVLGESEANYQSMENHLMRSEVQQALKGTIGKDIRHSKTLDTDLLYVAIAVNASNVVVRLSLPLTQLNSINRMIWSYITAGIFAGLLLTILLALKFSSSVTRPVNELITVSKQISTGNYSKRAKIKTNDELGQLADTFNEMASQLEHTVADLTDKNIKVETIMNSMINGIIAVDKRYRVVLINNMAREMFNIGSDADIIGTNIIEVVRNNQLNSFIKESIEKDASLVNEILITAGDERIFRICTTPIKSTDKAAGNSGAIAFIQDITNVRKLEQIRTDFVSNVTHELKTPLTSIRGFVETLRAGAIQDPEVADKFLEIIDIESERLYTLINDILQLSEIETRQKDSNIEPHSLNSDITEVMSFLKGVADKKGIRLIDETTENLTLSANRDRIKQMLINLIDNGIKYNSENGSVTVKAYRAEGKIVITVRDTGIGIAAEHITRIFERFYRVDKGRSREAGGTGLGLSIVKHIVNLYNGDLKVLSEPGRGTEFIVRFPL